MSWVVQHLVSLHVKVRVVLQVTHDNAMWLEAPVRIGRRAFSARYPLQSSMWEAPLRQRLRSRLPTIREHFNV